MNEECLNPCYNGLGTEILKKGNEYTSIFGLNPCYNGLGTEIYISGIEELNLLLS